MMLCFLLHGSPTLYAQQTAGQRIQPADDAYYWQYRKQPLVLMGGSKEDNLFQIDNLAEHLDTLTAAGGNYVRNTMSSRDAGNRWPFYRQPDGKYDLNRPDEAYYKRFADLLRLAAERDIIVQLELWDRFDFAREPWSDNPYNPANNINYTTQESTLQAEYPNHPGKNDNPFFRSIPAHDDNPVLLPYQHAHIDRVLDIALPYPNVLYTMDNETSATAEWGAYWSAYVQQKASQAGVQVYTTEMWDAWDLKDEQHRRTLDHPDLYAFVDISQNNHNTGEAHWNNLQWVRSYVAHQPRPLNHVKIYGADTGNYGSQQDALERFWRSLIGGAASVRFHRPPSGIGLSAVAQQQLRSARMLLDSIRIFESQPDIRHQQLSDRDDNEAYLTYIPDQEYVAYFPAEGSVMLDLTRAQGTFTLRWLHIAGQRWSPPATLQAGRQATLSTPEGDGQWVAVVQKN